MALAVACGGGGGDGDGSGGRQGTGGDGLGGEGGGGRQGTGGGASSVTFATLESVAKLLYDDIATIEGEPDGDEAAHIDHLPSHIAGALEGLGFPFLDEDELDDDEFEKRAEELLADGVPFATTTSVYQLARAYDAGMLVDSEGYFEGLEDHGVTSLLGDLVGVGDFVSSQVYSAGLSAAYEPDVPVEPTNITAVFLWVLGQERARRFGGEDPMWGDGLLDPLQFTLLNYTIFSKAAADQRTREASFGPGFKPASPGKFIKGKAKDFIKDQFKDQAKDAATDVLQDILGVPLDPLEGAQVSVCASLLLYGHKVYLENDPRDIWRKRSGTPNSTTVSLLLNFEDDYSNNTKGQVAAFLSDCDLPPKGFVPGKPVEEWSVAGGIVEHGFYVEMDTETDELGEAHATWETFEDEYREDCRADDLENIIVDGVTQAKVSGLLPDWSTLETIVTFLRPGTGAEGEASLAVHYKEQRTDRNCHYPD